MGGGSAEADVSGIATDVRREWALAGIMLALTMAAIESTIVAGAMPSIVGSLGNFDLFSWVFTAYLLPQAVTVPLYGRLADIHGRKRVLISGASIFLLGSVLCGFANGMVPLILFRALQGTGAGAILPLCMTVLGDLYAPTERARIQGVVSVVWGAAAVAGPMVGAVLIAYATWSAVFWVCVPLGLTSLAVLRLTLREKLVRREHSIDLVGSVLMVIGSGAILVAIVQGRHLDDRLLIGLVATGVAVLGLFALHERRTPEPLLPVMLWRHPVLTAANTGALIIGATMMATTAFLPAYVQGTMARGPLVSGSVVAVLMAAWPFGNIASGRLMARGSYRATAALGAVALGAGSMVLITLTPARGPLWAASGALVTGIGMGLCNTTFLVATQASVDWAHRGIATSGMLFMRIVGQLMGASIFGGILNSRLADVVRGNAAEVDMLMAASTRAQLNVATVQALSDAIAGALHVVYIIAGLLSAAAFVLAFGFPAGMGPDRPNKGAG